AFAVPAIAHLLLWLSGRDRPMPAQDGDRREEALLALILAVATLAIPVIEGPQNVRALVWTGEALLVALPWLRYWPHYFLAKGRRSSQVTA
ncbi:MAG TPA: hypothetical protein VF920_07270, partial [Dongiaceae bacterium]